MEQQNKVFDVNEIFDDWFLNSKAVYMHCFNGIPSISFVNHIDGKKAFEELQIKYSSLISSVHCYREYRRRKKDAMFSDTIVLLNNKCVLEFDRGYCEILYDYTNQPFVEELIGFLRVSKGKYQRKAQEINIVIKTGRNLELKPMEVKKTKLDIARYYEDDFKQIDELIRKRLNQKNDKGIVLLHGLPGTGKTTYLRYLVSKIRKKVIFLPPELAGSMVDPEMIELLVDNPNSVLVIEDAESIIMDRRSKGGSSVSNLLNITDGLLADFLNVQLLCTFNNALTMVDSALLRKGRLIAKYEFGKLSVAKAQALSNHLGMEQVITQPMTLAEITNPGETNYEPAKVNVIGFRRTHELIEN